MRDELRDLLDDELVDLAPWGTHIVRGELRPCSTEELAEALHSAGWRPAPYLAVGAGRVVEVPAAELGYVDAHERPIGGVVRFTPTTPA